MGVQPRPFLRGPVGPLFLAPDSPFNSANSPLNNLAGNNIQEEGASLPIKASPYQTGRLGPREKLLHALHAADRLLVLGGPGSTESPQRAAGRSAR